MLGYMAWRYFLLMVSHYSDCKDFTCWPSISGIP